MPLDAGNFARFDARRACVYAFGGGADDGAHPLDVGIPAALGTPMGVRDVVAEAGSLAADIAVGSHGALLAFVVVLIAVTSGSSTSNVNRVRVADSFHRGRTSPR